MAIAPIDLAALVTAVFYGIAALCIPLATVYIMITAARTKELNTKIDGMLVDRDAANVRKGEQKGEQKGEEKADALAEGQRQGREIARADVIARGLESNTPLPVEDEAAAVIAERVADATEKGAKAQERVAEATEKRKP